MRDKLLIKSQTSVSRRVTDQSAPGAAGMLEARLYEADDHTYRAGRCVLGLLGIKQPKSAGPPRPGQIVLNPITTASLFPSYQAPCSFSLIFHIWPCTLYHCLLMRQIIIHSIIRPSAHDRAHRASLVSQSPGRLEQRGASQEVRVIAGITPY